MSSFNWLKIKNRHDFWLANRFALLFICSLASINFSSASSTQILVSKSWATKHLGSNFQIFYPHQPQSSADFWNIRPYNVSVFMIYSNPHCQNICLVFLSFVQISPFLFQYYQQIVNTAFLKPEMQKHYPYLNMKSRSSIILTMSPLIALPFF